MGRLFVALQYLLPHHVLCAVMYRAVRWRAGWWKNLLIRVIGGSYGIDLGDAVRKSPDEYVSFNDYFTRELEDGARPMPENASAIACPVDGKISQMGPIHGLSLLQAKGHDYDVAALLGGQSDWAQPFESGQFATIYLAPYNYHRIHAPLAGQLTHSAFVPGRLFSVSPLTVEHVPGIFARNERLVTLWETEYGPMAMVLVGAIFVSSIQTVWHGEYAARRKLELADFRGQEIQLSRGDEMGRFNMGSTIVMLLPPGAPRMHELPPGEQVRLGQALT